MSRKIESSRRPQPQRLQSHETATTVNNFLWHVQQAEGNQVSATVTARDFSDESIRGMELVAEYHCQTPRKKITLQQAYAIVTKNELRFIADVTRHLLRGLVIIDHHLIKMEEMSPHLQFAIFDPRGIALNEEDRKQLRKDAEERGINPMEPLPLW